MIKIEVYKDGQKSFELEGEHVNGFCLSRDDLTIFSLGESSVMDFMIGIREQVERVAKSMNIPMEELVSDFFSKKKYAQYQA